MAGVDWKDAPFADLQTRGFVHARGFLSAAELAFHREEYEREPVRPDNLNYDLTAVQGRAKEALEGRVKEVLALVAAATDLRPDLPADGCYFATRRGIQFGWHQDHESFFTVQNHYDYLNFYLPILKPRKDKSNLCVIPFDALQQQSPRVYQKVVRAGAATYVRFRERTLVLHDDTGGLSLMEGDIERLAHTPQLEAGDLLLLRGDMIHRTEDADTERVALSFRAVRSGASVRRSRLAEGGLTKAWMMMNDAGRYERIFQAFDQEGREEMAYHEMLKALERLPSPDSMGRKRFLRYLLGQKRREHVLLRFFRRSLSSLFVANTAALFLKRPAPGPLAPASPDLA